MWTGARVKVTPNCSPSGPWSPHRLITPKTGRRPMTAISLMRSVFWSKNGGEEVMVEMLILRRRSLQCSFGAST